MTMNGDLVSVIMPVYNAAPWLQKAVESVLTQSHGNLELIAVDDGSQDGSPSILDNYANADSRIRVYRQPFNSGVSEARNVAIAAARGDFIAFLDADDWWLPEKLERQLAGMRESGALISYTAYWRIAADGRTLGEVTPPQKVSWNDMLASNFIGNLTGMYSRQLGDVRFQRIGHEDYAFWLEQVRRAGSAERIATTEPLAALLVHAHSLSSNKFRAAAWQWAIYRDVEKLGVLRSMICMARYVGHALAKRS